MNIFINKICDNKIISTGEIDYQLEKELQSGAKEIFYNEAKKLGISGTRLFFDRLEFRGFARAVVRYRLWACANAKTKMIWMNKDVYGFPSLQRTLSVHELLHIKHPKWSESRVRRKTHEIVDTRESLIMIKNRKKIGK